MRDAPATPSFTIAAGDPGRPVARHWEVAVGCGDAWSLLRADLQEQLRRAARECGFRYLRCHGVLCDQLQVIRRDRAGALVYNWQLVDAAYDALLTAGLRPFVELGFMPAALASGDRTIFHYRANVTPPADDDAWAALVGALAAHWRERYGAAEVRRWYFEVWNEPNLTGQFWTGTAEDYYRLYAATARALKAVDPALRVGGPATTRGEWLPEFLAWCRAHDAPVDFVSTHVYPDDDDFAKTDPGYPALFARGDYLDTLVARVHAAMAGERPVGPGAGERRLEIHWTEWNISWRWGRPVHDESNAAAFICQVAAATDPLVDSFAFWTVSDIFNEFPYPRAALVGGFGLLNVAGLPKPAYHAYRLLHRLGDRALPVAASGAGPSERQGRLGCLATRDDGGAYRLLLSHYVPPALAEAPPPPAEVALRLRGLPPGSRWRLTAERVDADHADLLGAWRALGSPETPTPAQLARLRDASALRPEPERDLTADAAGDLDLPATLPAAGVLYHELRPR